MARVEGPRDNVVMRSLAALSALALTALACSRDPQGRAAPPASAGAPAPVSSPTAPPSAGLGARPAPPSAGPGARPAAPGPSIGVAKMKADGTLELRLRGPGGAEALAVYPPTHAEYKKTLGHLGGMRPGEEKPVPPWPDPWDAAKVEAAAHAHAAKKGWARADYTVEIMGTDAEGHAVVTLAHVDDRALRRPGGGRSVSLRIETKTYTVAHELHLQ